MAEIKTFVHLGAHRTGSSSFQVFLGHNRVLLKQAGFNLIYPDRDGAIGGYSRRIDLPSQSIAPEKHRPYFRHFVKPMQQRFGQMQQSGCIKTILSEENILGRMGLFFRGRFYPQAGLRLDLVQHGLQQPIDNALLVVRNYGDLYQSSAAMLAQIRERPPFEQTVQNLMEMQTGWPDLVNRLLRRGHVKKITVVPYEHRGDDANLLQLLCGERLARLEPAPHRPNISPSAPALEELQKRYIAGENLSIEQRENIIAEYPQGKGGNRYDPFTKIQKTTLTERYKQDLETLSMNPAVTFITT